MAGSTKRYDLLIIGLGLAGMAAAAFARRQGLRTVQAGGLGQSNFSSGLLDLLAVHPVDQGQAWDDPFQALQALIRDEPEHPYALVGQETIHRSLEEFCAFLESLGLPYTGHPGRNARVITAAGTVKRTYRMPAWMWASELGLQRKAPALLVDFQGLEGYSAEQIAGSLERVWPGMKTVRLSLPGVNTAYVEHMAMAMEGRECRERLADMLQGHLGGVEMVGFPAILGIAKPRMVHAEMERLLGVEVFEIPVMPPAVTGMRIKTAFEDFAAVDGLRLYNMALISRITHEGGVFRTEMGPEGARDKVEADNVLLATGRFFGQGLRADRHGIVEPLFGLPVAQPATREGWHGHDFWDPAGHPVNRAGLRTDSRFRPLGPDGRPAHERLFAAGSILANQDWMRQKCGAGLAICTAYAAVDSIPD